MLAKNSIRKSVALGALTFVAIVGALLGALLGVGSGSGFAFGFGSKTPAAQETAVSSGVVWVTRPDGTQQCSPGSGESLGDSAQELRKANVRVLGSQKGSDNQLHAQMCGLATGSTNMFQISKKDLGKAIALGFHEVRAP